VCIHWQATILWSASSNHVTDCAWICEEL